MWIKDNLEHIIGITLSLSILATVVVGGIEQEPRVVERITEVEVLNTIIIPDSSSNIKYQTCNDLIEALIYVESNGRDSIVNPTSGATGCLQLLPIMVKEVNRILKKVGSTYRYTLEDRFSREKSIQMFRIWRLYHHANHSYEIVARNWNGGPNGYLMPATISYWGKVKKHLKKKK